MDGEDEGCCMSGRADNDTFELCPVTKKRIRTTLKQRIGLCLAAFFAALAMQIGLNVYQARAVQDVAEKVTMERKKRPRCALGWTMSTGPRGRWNGGPRK